MKALLRLLTAILSSQEFPAARNITYAEVYSVGERVQAFLLLNVSEATLSFLRLLARFVYLRHVRGSPPVVEFAACPGMSNRALVNLSDASCQDLIWPAHNSLGQRV